MKQRVSQPAQDLPDNPLPVNSLRIVSVDFSTVETEKRPRIGLRPDYSGSVKLRGGTDVKGKSLVTSEEANEEAARTVLSRNRSTITTLDKEIEDKEQELAAVKKMIEAGRLADQRERQQLEIDLAGSRQAIAVGLETVKKKEASIAQREAQLATSDALLQSTTKDLQQKQSTLDKARAKLQDDRQASKKEMADNKVLLAVLRQKQRVIQRAITALEKTNARLVEKGKTECEHLESELYTLHQSLTDTKKEQEILSIQIEQRRHDLTSRERTLRLGEAALARQMREWEANLTERKRQTQDERKAITVLRREKNKLVLSTANLTQEAARLQRLHDAALEQAATDQETAQGEEQSRRKVLDELHGRQKRVAQDLQQAERRLGEAQEKLRHTQKIQQEAVVKMQQDQTAGVAAKERLELDARQLQALLKASQEELEARQKDTIDAELAIANLKTERKQLDREYLATNESYRNAIIHTLDRLRSVERAEKSARAAFALLEKQTKSMQSDGISRQKSLEQRERAVAAKEKEVDTKQQMVVDRELTLRSAIAEWRARGVVVP